MAPLAVHSCHDLILQRRWGGVAPDGRREVNRGQNVAEIKQIGSELKERKKKMTQSRKSCSSYSSQARALKRINVDF